MRKKLINLPCDIPAFLRHSDNDTPVPSWKQVTRSVHLVNTAMVAHVSRIVAGADDPLAASEIWDAWPRSCQRSVALLIDKICHEGWLELVGPLVSWPWDGGFFFWPRSIEQHHLNDVLDAKSQSNGVYTRCSFQGGLAAYLTGRNHKAWKRSWIENDSPFASLHVGIFENGSAEVHLDLFNPVYTNGAPRSEIRSLPGLGSYNRKLLKLHREWEGADHGAMSRTSANFYHLMRGRVPICF